MLVEFALVKCNQEDVSYSDSIHTYLTISALSQQYLKILQVILSHLHQVIVVPKMVHSYTEQALKMAKQLAVVEILDITKDHFVFSSLKTIDYLHEDHYR